MVRRGGSSRDPYRDEYEYEEEIDRRRRRLPRRDYPEKPEKRRSPLLLRVFSWLGIVLFCFVAGYLGTSWMLRFLDKQFLMKPEGRIETQEDLKAFEEERKRENQKNPSQAAGGDIHQLLLRLYYVKEGALTETQQSFVARTQEDNVKEAVESLLNLSGVGGKGNPVRVLHVFRSADTVFLDFSDPLLTVLTDLGERQSLILLTGIVRTMQENFPPIVKVRFLVNSAVPTSGSPVDLTVPWQLPKP